MTAGPRARHRPRLHLRRRRRRPLRRRADRGAQDAGHRAQRRAGARGGAALPGPGRAGAPFLRRGRGRQGGRPVRRPRPLGQHHAADAAGLPVPGAADVHRDLRLRPGAAAVATTSRSRPTSTSPPSRRARSRCSCCSAARCSAALSGRSSVQPVPWHKETQVRMPVAVWREAMDAHFPGQAWLRLSRTTYDDLATYRGTHGLVGWDDVVAKLLRGGGLVTRRARGRPARSPTRCSTRATCSTPTAPARRRTRCAGSGAC